MNLYTKPKHDEAGGGRMAENKNIAMSFRVTPRFKALLEAAASRENRSLTNMLERLVFDHCRKHRLDEPSPATSVVKRSRK